MENKELKLDISEKVRSTFNKIAKWHNGDEDVPSKSNLLELSQNIVEDVLNFSIHELSQKTKVGIECDQDALKEAMKKKIEEFESSKKTEENPKKKRFFGLF